MSLARWLAELSPEAALGPLAAGILLIYAELNRPGRVFPGAIGLLLVLLACARVYEAHPRPVSLVLLATAVALLAVELLRASHVWVAAAATVALVLGFRELLTPPVAWAVCILSGVALGIVTSVLARVARRAKANKASH